MRRGPYRLIRHPAYLGTIVGLFGLGLALGGWLGALAAGAITFAGHVPRIRAEEAMLADAFGDDLPRLCTNDGPARASRLVSAR